MLAATLVFASLGHALPAESADVPLPRPRPPIAAAPAVAVASDHGPPTDCDRRLGALAEFRAEPTLVGPGECGGADLVKVNSLLLPDGGRIAVEPPATLRCSMAESLAAWIRDEIVPRLKPLGAPLRVVEDLDSYECRGGNGAAGGKISEHGKGNAIDVRGFRLTDGRKIVLTDVAENKSLREDVRARAADLRPCSGRARTVTTSSIFILMRLSATTAIEFVNGPCAERSQRSPASRPPEQKPPQ